MNMKKKKSGFIFFTVVIITIMLTSVTMMALFINTAHARDVGNDSMRNKAYYIANAGLEMAYAALNEPVSELGGSILSITRIGKDSDRGLSQNVKDFILFDSEANVGKKGIIQENKVELKSKDGSETLVYTKFSGDLGVLKQEITNSDGSKEERTDLYYRVVCVGSTKPWSDPTNTAPMNSHVLTMFVFVSDPNSPKIFNGDKEKPN